MNFIEVFMEFFFGVIFDVVCLLRYFNYIKIESKRELDFYLVVCLWLYVEKKGWLRNLIFMNGRLVLKCVL